GGGGERELLGAVVSGDFNGDGRGVDARCGKVNFAELRRTNDLHNHADASVIRNLRSVDLEVVDRGAEHAAGRVIQAAVEQLDAIELRRVGNAVDGVQDRVDLELIGLD